MQERKKYTGWFIVVGVLGGSLVLCCAAFLAIGAVNSNTNHQQQAAASFTQTPGPPTATPKPKVWTVVQTYSGNGNQTTGRFTINSDDWHLVWSCDPSSFYGGSYNVAVDVDYADGTPADPAAVNTICQAGNTSGTTDVQNVTGSVYLAVLSESSWTIKVEVLE